MEIVEILSALRHCASHLGCDTCPMRADIERRAFCVATLLQESKTAITELLADIDAAKRRCAQAQAERDALLEQIKARRSCLDCKYFDYCEFDDATVIDCMNCVTKNCPCYQCGNSSRWEWRGLPEAPKGGEKA